MDIRILHIDDERDVLEQVKAVVDQHQIGDNRLLILDSCGFEEGLQKLEEREYDLVILDLCRGSASDASDKVGEIVFGEIQSKAFIPIIFFTGLPDYVAGLKSDIVRVAGKGEGYDALFTEIETLITSGFLALKGDVNKIVAEGLRSYFWNFVHKNTAIISKLKEDDVSLKYLLLRRLGKTLSTEIARTAAENPGFNKANSHPMEFYIYPPMDGEFETGDLLKSKTSEDYYIILTPSCDLVMQPSGKRSAEKVLVVHTIDFRAIPEFQKMEELQAKQKELLEKKQQMSNQDSVQLAGLPKKIKERMRPNNNPRYFFLPKTPFCPAMLVDFEQKTSLDYEKLEEDFTIVATLDDPINLAVMSNYTRYYSRVGYQDVDVDYAFSQLME